MRLHALFAAGQLGCGELAAGTDRYVGVWLVACRAASCCHRVVPGMQARFYTSAMAYSIVTARCSGRVDLLWQSVSANFCVLCADDVLQQAAAGETRLA